MKVCMAKPIQYCKVKIIIIINKWIKQTKKKFVCFNPILYFTPPLETIYLFSVSMSMFVLFYLLACFIFLYSIHKWDYMIFVFLFIISLSIISYRSIHVEVNGRFHTSLCSVTQSFLTLCDPMDCSPPGSSVYVIFQARNIGVGCHVLLQGIFPIQGSNSHLFHLLHWQVGSLPRSHLGSPIYIYMSSLFLYWWTLRLIPYLGY